jgi:glycosyltransferase involved in cell wall biosynthesis
MTCPVSLLPLIEYGQWKEKARSLLVRSLPFTPWWRFIISKATIVIAANRETAALMQPFRRVEVPIMLETAVTPEAIQSEPRHQSPKKLLSVLWLGHLIPRKAPVLAIRALALALKADPDIALVVAGGGPEEARLRDEVERLGIGHRVSFTGRVPKTEVNTLMDVADAFLFTSIRDTSGNVVLEAMSRALPVVTLWHQGVRDICNSDCALVVKPSGIEDTTADIAKSLIRLKQEEGLAARLGKAGQKHVAAQHTWRNYCSRMFKIYQAAVNK